MEPFSRTFALNYSSPLLYEGASGCEVVVRGAREIARYSLANGEEIGSIAVDGPNIVSSPALHDGRVVSVGAAMETPPTFSDPLGKYDTNGSGALEWSEITKVDDETTLVLQRLAENFGNKDKTLTSPEWSDFWVTMKGSSGVSVSDVPLSGQTKGWTQTRTVPRVSTPLVYDGLVYLINNGGILNVLDASTGEPVKVARVPGVTEAFFASPVAADGIIYLASEDGKLVSVQAARDWQTEKPVEVLNLPEPLTDAVPAGENLGLHNLLRIHTRSLGHNAGSCWRERIDRERRFSNRSFARASHTCAGGCPPRGLATPVGASTVSRSAPNPRQQATASFHWAVALASAAARRHSVRARGWVSSHVDIVDKFSASERPADSVAYTHKLNLELDTGVSVFKWLPEGCWLRGR